MTPQFYRQETSFIFPEDARSIGRFDRSPLEASQNRTIADLLTEALLEFRVDDRSSFQALALDHFPANMLEGSVTYDSGDDDVTGNDFDKGQTRFIIWVPIAWFCFYMFFVEVVPFILVWWRKTYVAAAIFMRPPYAASYPRASSVFVALTPR